MNSLQDYSVVSLLPESLKIDPFIIALAEAIEIELKEAYREAEIMSGFSDVDKLPETLLDYLAYQKHVDFYENSLPIEQKRKLVKNATMWHQKKGTPWAVEQVTSIVFPNAEVLEWFDYSGDPYKFKIEVGQPFIARKDINRLKAMVEATKNKRSLLDGIAVKMNQTDYLELESNQYSYPIYLPICGEIYSEGLPGTEQQTTVEAKVENYTYPVHLPIAGELYAGEVMEAW